MVVPLALTIFIVPVWKHCLMTQRSVWSSLSNPIITRTSDPMSGGSTITMSGSVPGVFSAMMMTPPFIARARFEAVISAIVNVTVDVRPVVEISTGSSSSATSTLPEVSA